MSRFIPVAAMLLLGTLPAAADDAAPRAGQPGSVLASRHNFSVSGPGRVRSLDETQVCVFCHLGHGGTTFGQETPGSAARYRTYASTTLAAPMPSTPSGASRICLSCHDGTIALGRSLAPGGPLRLLAPSGTAAAGPRRAGTGEDEGTSATIGTDLRRSHPVSFAPVPSARYHVLSPSGDVRLDRQGQLQCTSCHDPHREDADPVRGKFLRRANTFSGLCLTCHAPAYWATNPSAHESSTATVARSRERFPYGTVAENGCEACHRSHDASPEGRLVKARDGERASEACMACHDGRVARLDLGLDLAKPFSHAEPPSGPQVHDAAEKPNGVFKVLPEQNPSAPRHATCVDCHNPHASYRQEAVAPRVSGALAGVSGIDRAGNPVNPAQYEYEICFKCHGDSANQPQARGPTPPESLRRAVNEVNLRRQLDHDAPSFHPVEGPGRGTDVPSLIAPLTVASVVYCSDCHASDTGPGSTERGRGARGPHGSVHLHQLERALSTTDGTIESPGAYALCYKCHDRDVLLSDRSAFKEHMRHVVKEGAPCTACHASHGVSVLQGNIVGNAHLMDFDVSIVGTTPFGVRKYEKRGPRTGTCTVTCHGKLHDATAYGG